MSDPSARRRGIRASTQTDAALRALAGGQWWIVDRVDLADLGIDRHGAARRVRSGMLYPLLPRAYVVGQPVPSWHGRFLASVRSCGRRAAIGFESSGALRGLLRTTPARIDVVLPSSGLRRPQLDLHWCRELATGDVEEVDGIPVTSLARTAIDLAAAGSHRTLELMLRAAEEQRLDATAVLAVAHERRPGAPLLRAVLAELEPDGTTASDFEDEFRLWLRRGGPAGSRHNLAIIANGARYVLDVAWPAARLAVELDPFSTHGSRRAFERDRHKDADLLLEGIAVVRVTPTRVRRDGAALRRTLERLVADRSVDAAVREARRRADG